MGAIGSSSSAIICSLSSLAMGKVPSAPDGMLVLFWLPPRKITRSG